MSKTDRRPKLSLLLAAVLIAALAVSMPAGASAAPVVASATPNVIQAPADPPASGLPGDWAQTSCSEGDEIAYTEGWRVNTQGSYPSMYGAIDNCLSTGGGLELRDEGSRDTEAFSGPAFTYEGPVDSTIVGGVMKIHVKTPNGGAYIYPYGSPESPPIYECTTACASGKETTISLGNPATTALLAYVMCLPPSQGSPCESGQNAELSITSSTIMLHNTATPGATGFGGTLLNNPTSGTGILSFTAQDQDGPGVYRVSAQIDGHEMASETPNVNEGKCVAYGNFYGALNFRWRQPCPTETAAQVEIPTTAIADGQHELEIEVEDAAGHRSVVYQHTITIKNAHVPLTEPTTTTLAGISPPAPPARGPANGSPASETARLTAQWGSTSATRLTSSYGHSQLVTGKLTDATGTPISGAAIEVSRQPSSLGAVASAIAATHTASNGSFTIRVPSDSSSAIQLAYRSHLGDTQPAAMAAVTLQVPASLHLTVAPHLTRVGQRIVLSGTLAGTIPPTGKKVLFEARAVGTHKWIEFHNATATATSHGRFHTSHRFALPGPERYEFRVVCEREADFPFLAGASNRVRVRER